MRALDEIVRRNAKREIDSHIATMRQNGYEVTEFTIAARMAAVLDKEHRSVHRQLKRYLHEEHTWRIDYIDALAVALGIAPQLLVNLDLKNAPPELTVAGSLYRGLNERLTVAQSRALVDSLHQLQDTPGRWDLSNGITEILIDAETHEEAFQRITVLLADSKTREEWGRRTGTLVGRKVGRKKKQKR